VPAWALGGVLSMSMSNPRRSLSAKAVLLNLAHHVRWRLRWRSWPARHPEQAMLGFLLVVVFGWVYRGLWGTRQILIGDLTPWYLGPGVAWSHFVNAWSDTNLGWANPLSFGLAIPQVLLTGITQDPGLAQRLFYLPLMPLGIVSMYLLLRYLVTSRAVRLLVAFAYGINGFSITWFSVGSYPVLFTQLGLPLMLLFFLKYLREPAGRPRNLILFTIVFALTTGAQPYTLLRLLLIFPMALVVEPAWRASRSSIVNTLLGLFGAASLFLLLTAPLSTRLLESAIGAVGMGGDVSLGLSGARSVNNTIATLVTNFSSAHATEMRTPIFISLLLLILPIPFLRDRTIKRWYLGYVTVAALAVGVMLSFAAGIADPVLRQFPFLLPLQDPNKLHSIFLFPAFLALAMGLEALSRRRPVSLLRIKIHSHVALGGAVFIAGLFVIMTEAHAPFDSNVTNLERFVTTGLDKSGQITYEIPAAYEEAAIWLRQQHAKEGFFRTLWLPDDKTLQRNVLPIIDPPSFRKPEDPELTLLALNALHAGATGGISTVIREFGVRYIIVVDPVWNWDRWELNAQGFPHYIEAAEQGYVTIGDPAIIRDYLSRTGEFEITFEGQGFVVFSIPEPKPHVSVYTKRLLVAPLEAIAPPSPFNRQLADQNLIVNGGFTNGFEEWTTVEMPGAAYSVSQEADGYAARVTAPPRPNYGAIIQSIPLKASSYELSIMWRANETSRVSVKLEFMNSAKEVVAVEGKSNIRKWSEATPQWSRYQTSITAPRNTTSMQLIIEVEGDRKTKEQRTVDLKDIKLNALSAGVESLAQAYLSNPDIPNKLRVVAAMPGLVTTLPAFNAEATHVALVDGESWPLSEESSHADAIVFLGNPKPGVVTQTDSTDPLMLFLFEGESDLSVDYSPGALPSEILPGKEYANNRALMLPSAANSRLSARLPLPSFYRIMVRGKLGVIRLTVDGVPLAIEAVETSDGEVLWHETPPVYLESGEHTVAIANLGEESVVDQVGLLSVADLSTGSSAVRSAPVPLVDTTQVNSGELSLSVLSERPYTVLFREAYNDGWEASAEGTELDHQRMGLQGWANGFYSPTLGQEVTIKYDGQDQRRVLIAIWLVSWLITILALVVMTSPTLRNQLARITTSSYARISWRGRTGSQ